jgi:hypothetical protein
MYGGESLKSAQTTKARQICYIISRLGYPHLDPLLCHLANTNYGSRLMMQSLLSLGTIENLRKKVYDIDVIDSDRG